MLKHCKIDELWDELFRHVWKDRFPQEVLWVWTRDTWTTLEFLRNIDFPGAIWFEFSCATIKELPWSPWKTYLVIDMDSTLQPFYVSACC